ncbi:unnamed protein product [Rangifer tarandus platyrhynchus]|uniref:Uncharacterized protein n=1 Tax=Rangifer tarandus platyrhynchus TaxID=3082113 RepID=A0AC59ZX76_RANTA
MKAFAHLILLALLCPSLDTTTPTVPSTSTSTTDTTTPTTDTTTTVTSTPTSTTSTITPTTTSTTTTDTTTPTTDTTTTVTSTPTSTTSTITPTTTSTTTTDTTTPTTDTTTTVTSTPTSTTSTITPTTTSTTTTDTTTPTTDTTTTVTSTPTSTTSTITPTTTSTTTTDTTTPTVPSTSTSTTDTTTPTTDITTTVTSTPTSTTSTITPTTTSYSTPCKEDSCQGGSLCVNLHNDYVCLCSEGYYYNSSTCKKGKIFPGTIKVKISYTAALENKTSVLYQELYILVTTFFKDTFNISDYGQTVIVKVSISASARSEMRAGNQGVDVAVVNIFTETTKENETTISNAIRNAINAQPSNFSGYDQQDRCDYYGCKKPNDQNDCDSDVLCECQEGLVRPNPQMLMCLDLGPTCPETCNEQSKKQCLVTNSTSAYCMCLPGYEEDSKGICQKCAFGYSGINCKDSFQLILTIVGTIAGIIILGMVITLIVSMRLKNKGKNGEEETLIEKDSQNLRLKETGFSNLGAEGSIFPKIRVNLPRDNQPENPYTRPGILPRPDY